MASVGKASLVVVAASMAAVEALKDQVGLCRWNYAMRSLHRHAKAELSWQAPAAFFASEQNAGNRVTAAASVEETIRRRKAEKADRVMHLVCWGPN